MISRKLSIEFLGGDKLLSKAKAVYIASASVSKYSLELLLRNVNSEVQLHFLIGIHLPSHIEALEMLMKGHEEGRWQFRIYTKSFFHPKLYLFQGTDLHRTFVGSGNFTKGGWIGNEELFHIEYDKESFNSYKAWFNRKFSEGVELDNNKIDILKNLHQKKIIQEQEESNEMVVVESLLNGNFNLDAIDFTNQFFVKEHHEIFSPLNKRRENVGEIKDLRKSVRKALFELHDLVWPHIQSKGWQIYPHYQTDDIISSIELGFHSSHEIGAMWLHYGRDKSEIKRYGNDETPLFYSRLQVIIHYSDVGIWLRFGKAGGSRQDREYFQKQMTLHEYRDKYYNHLRNLGNEYWIRIGEESRNVLDFKTPQDLQEFTQIDNWRQDYFIIGTTIELGSDQLSMDRITDTILTIFEKLYPLYKLMKDKTFES